MSKEALAKVVQRAISDGAFRRQLSSDPSGALRGFDLSSDEFAAIKSGDSGRLTALGVDLRMSKAFTLSSDQATGGSVLNSVSNDLGASYTGATTTVDQGSAGSSALISGDASDTDPMIIGDGTGRDATVIPGEPAHALGAQTGGDSANFDATLTGGGGAGFDNVLTPGDNQTEGVVIVDEQGLSGATNPGEAADGTTIQE